MHNPILLIVDDEPRYLEQIAPGLQRRYNPDYDVLTVQSPQAAIDQLKLLKQQGRQVAVVLADLWMPGMTGPELLAPARRKHPHTRRVLLVDWIEDANPHPTLRHAILGSMETYLPKPLAEPDEQFYRVIADLLGDWTSEHETRTEVLYIVDEQR
jgi:thioredoxin reductase (NADPH)